MGNAVAKLDLVAQLTMRGIVVVVHIGQAELVCPKHTARFEHTVSFAVDTFDDRSMAGCFNGVDCIEGILFEGKVLFV